jgi:hypothetical protein
MSMLKHLIAGSVIVACAAWGSSALAAKAYKSQDTRDPAQIAADACKDAVGKAVKKKRGTRAQRVQFLSDQHDVSQASTAETSVTGAGQYQGPDGTFTSFTYDCIFNIRTGKVTRQQWRE